MKVTFDHSRDEAANIKTFLFKPEKPVHFTAGQFAEWTLKHNQPDSRGQKRWFTISTSPNQEVVGFTTKLASDKKSSFKSHLLDLTPGDQIEMSQPMGDFVLPKLIQTPLVFVAGGIGITPFHSILNWLSETKEERDIKMIYGVNSEDEIIFQETFDTSGIHPTTIVAHPSTAWGGERGNLSAELIMGLAKPSTDTLVYVSGPEPMVEKLEKDLKKAGLDKKQFVGDFFPNYRSI